MKKLKFFIVPLIVLLQACTQTPQTSTLMAQSKQAYAHKDYQTAFQNAYAAAERNDADAEYALGYLYYNGLGVKRDQSAALHWFKKAAQQGQASAIKALKTLDNIAENQAYNL